MSLQSGEDQGVPQARSLLLQGPQEIRPTATSALLTPNFATLSPVQEKGRQANPDIQDIITGIVKLLNGNVNVQANTAPGVGRPLRPLSTRINNRGPPRITDVPALPPDFDVPAPPLPPPPIGQMPPPVSSTRIPTPYPFDVPPSNVSPKRPPIPISEQVIPNGKRPSFYRPVTIPPWNRPRRPGTRKPIPAYKPLPSDMISLTSEKPMEDILTLDLGTHLESVNSGEITSNETMIDEKLTNGTDTPEEVSLDSSENEENELDEIDKNNILNATDTLSILENVTSSSISNTVTESEIKSSEYDINSSTSTSTAVPSPSSSAMESLKLNATSEKVDETMPILESSIQEVLHTLKEDLLNTTSILSTTPTETLSDTLITESVTKTIQSNSSTKLSTSNGDKF